MVINAIVSTPICITMLLSFATNAGEGSALTFVTLLSIRRASMSGLTPGFALTSMKLTMSSDDMTSSRSGFVTNMTVLPMEKVSAEKPETRNFLSVMATVSPSRRPVMSANTRGTIASPGPGIGLPSAIDQGPAPLLAGSRPTMKENHFLPPASITVLR